MSSPDQEWPVYQTGIRDYLHAVGVLITNWNNIETAYQAFFQLIFYRDINGGIRAFQLLSNEARIKVIREELLPNLKLELANHIDHFIKMANICYGNRNVFAHATAHNYLSEDKFRISKGTGKENIGAQYLFSLTDLREMADSSHDTFMYGIRLWGTIKTDETRVTMKSSGLDSSWLPTLPLPEKPSLPRSWDQIRETPKPHQPPP